MRRRLLRDAAFSLALLAAPVTVRAQSAIIYGSLGNFDISNDTGQICHGFEIEIGGVTPADVPGGFSAERYGAPSIVPYAGGTNVRWASPYDAGSQSFVERTLPHTVSWFPGQCYQWNPATYQDSGCEHFGSWTNANATHVTARWLCEDNANPGVLVPNDPPTAIPMPNYFVVPPVVAVVAVAAETRAAARSTARGTSSRRPARSYAASNSTRSPATTIRRRTRRCAPIRPVARRPKAKSVGSSARR
jgi:hypothetical protein